MKKSKQELKSKNKNSYRSKTRQRSESMMSKQSELEARRAFEAKRAKLKDLARMLEIPEAIRTWGDQREEPRPLYARPPVRPANGERAKSNPAARMNAERAKAKNGGSTELARQAQTEERESANRWSMKFTARCEAVTLSVCVWVQSGRLRCDALLECPRSCLAFARLRGSQRHRIVFFQNFSLKKQIWSCTAHFFTEDLNLEDRTKKSETGKERKHSPAVLPLL